MAKISGFGRFIAKCVQKTVWPTVIIGQENCDKFKGGIVISNHYASTPDGAIIFNAYFKNYFNALVKEEAFESKIGNWFLSKVGCIPVKRGKPDIDAYKKVMKVLKSGESILIFPEGTRNKAGTQQLAPFKEGVAVFAMRAHAEILPVIYYRMHKPFHKNIMLIGAPINLEELGFTRNDDKEATAFLYNRMCEMRATVNEIAKEKLLCK